MKNHIPNAITAANLFFGCLSIIATFDENLSLAAGYIVVAALLDYVDGFIARILNAHSEIGKQLDSLADVVSFGVAPGMIFYALSGKYLFFDENFIQFVPLIIVLSYTPLLIPIFSGIRLAKFNIDPRQSDSFIGVPTPAIALFICSIPFVIEGGPVFAEHVFKSFWFIILFPFVASYLLVAEIPLIALKFKTFGWEVNKIRYILIIACILLISFFKYFGISLSILLYVLLSLINNLFIHKK